MEDHGMSKRHQQNATPPQAKISAAKPATVAKEQPAPQREIEAYRRCPICWQGNGGYGLAYSTQGRTRYYKCSKTNKDNSLPCGHTWTALVTLESIRIEHRVVKIDGQR